MSTRDRIAHARRAVVATAVAVAGTLVFLGTQALLSSGCLPHRAPQVAAAAAASVPAQNRALALWALDVLTDTARLGTQVRELERALHPTVEQAQRFQSAFAAYQAGMDVAIEQVRTKSRAADPALREIGVAAAAVQPRVREVADLLRAMGLPASGAAVVDAFEVVLGGVASLGKGGTDDEAQPADQAGGDGRAALRAGGSRGLGRVP